MKAVYEVKYQFEGVNYTKKCTAYDIDTSVAGSLTMYFGDNHGRIVMPMYKVKNLSITCIWRM